MNNIKKWREAHELIKEFVKVPEIKNIEKNILISETQQYTKAFKWRGVVYNYLNNKEKFRNFSVASSGSHGIACAKLASDFNLYANIFVPYWTPKVKKDKLSNSNTKLTVVSGDVTEAIKKSKEFSELKKIFFAHPFEDEFNMIGHSTIIPLNITDYDFDNILIPIGGGGLASGVSSLIKDIFGNNKKIIGVELDTANSMQKSIEGGKLINVSLTETKAEAINVGAVSLNTMNYCAKNLDEIVTVSEIEISKIIPHLFNNDIKAEYGGAATYAAAKKYFDGEKNLVLITGGNYVK